MTDTTQFLQAFEQGDPIAAEELLPLVYQELRSIAAAKLATEKPGQTLQPTALVHEAWLRLLGPDHQSQSFVNRNHFLGAAAEAMRRILVDQARKKGCWKRGKGQKPINLEESPELSNQNQNEDAYLLLVDEALNRLAQRDPQKAELVKLRYFVGLNHAEVANAMHLSEKTVRRYWQFAKAWLYDDIERHGGLSS